jgi:hypothetical protein
VDLNHHRGDATIRIYLCGSVKKGLTDNRPETEFWSPQHEDLIGRTIKGNIELLNPSKTPISRKDYFTNFGCDLFLVQSSNLLIADLRSEKGIGVGAEMMFARQAAIPVIAWLPPESHYRRDLSNVFGEDLQNWMHPFAYALSDYLEDSLEAVCHRANAILSGSIDRISESKTIERAIDKFLTRYPEFRR